ncbi:MAG: maleylpyruvate isomerase N-terminal domain-containing protein [Candidatus Pseudobacter hemicellulosilyticus]|uniref:Maleylpyruvate isomerase N-terminal domain-containing protein n=1 Tax=Candidatus Pseudobacter hemicellulosilyticus TaxID=3121375 RepID=A0AAJ6BDI4_9BACT|nr:MAG: maleylpyruvate isomerase N-terminal domain-containing protein [Pseudobacter sp.]
MRTIPIPTAHLFPVADQLLISLLRSLEEKDWQRPTLARLWTVKDVAAHLLDGNMRVIALYRDHYFGEKPSGIHSYADLVHYLNQLNAGWVQASRRLSPALLTDLLENTGNTYSQLMAQQDPFADAVFSVAWAGEQTSPNWFHIAREFTEKMHHQLQIREAVGQTDPLMERSLFYPFIYTLLKGLPHAYRDQPAPDHTIISIEVTGPSGGHWQLLHQDQQWQLLEGNGNGTPAAGISIPAAIAWKLFTKGLSPAEALPQVQLSGNEAMAKVALSMIAVMA